MQRCLNILRELRASTRFATANDYSRTPAYSSIRHIYDEGVASDEVLSSLLIYATTDSGIFSEYLARKSHKSNVAVFSRIIGCLVHGKFVYLSSCCRISNTHTFLEICTSCQAFKEVVET